MLTGRVPTAEVCSRRLQPSWAAVHEVHATLRNDGSFRINLDRGSRTPASEVSIRSDPLNEHPAVALQILGAILSLTNLGVVFK
jgi:hypothetical protein